MRLQGGRLAGIRTFQCSTLQDEVLRSLYRHIPHDVKTAVACKRQATLRLEPIKLRLRVAYASCIGGHRSVSAHKVEATGTHCQIAALRVGYKGPRAIRASKLHRTGKVVGAGCICMNRVGSLNRAACATHQHPLCGIGSGTFAYQGSGGRCSAHQCAIADHAVGARVARVALPVYHAVKA